MNPNYKLFLILLFLSVFGLSYGQKTEIRKADSYLLKGEYFQALDYYKKAVAKGGELTKEEKIKVARCYYHLNDISTAFSSYLEFEEDLKGEDVYNLASCFHKEGGFEVAIEWYEKAKKEGANPIQMNELIKSCRWAMDNTVLDNSVLVNPAGLLIGGQSFGIQYYRNGVVYSSEGEEASKAVDKQGGAFLNLYYSSIKNGEIQPDKEPFSKNLLFNYHVGAISYTSDYKTMYFTKSVRIKGGNSRLKIFSVVFDGKDWVDEKELSLNNDDYDLAHPAVSPDDQYLYFVSNQKGGFGGKDLYRAVIKDNGNFGKVENLGKEVNTFGDEMFPFISKDNKLYFASDGHIGYGGLDLFVATYEAGNWYGIKNLGQPINSTKDDFGYVLDPKDKFRGFLSSNRGGSGDVVFSIAPKGEVKSEESAVSPPVFGGEEKKVEAPVVIPAVSVPAVVTPPVSSIIYPSVFTTNITSTFNGNAIEGVEVEIRDLVSGLVIGKSKTDAKGNISIQIPDKYKTEKQEFEIVVSKGTEFTAKRMIVGIQEIEDFKSNGLTLTPIFNDVVLDEISNMVIPYRGDVITEEGLATLDKLAGFLQKNPHVVIKLNGHTEARGNMYNNLDISQNVSEKAEAYLVSKGVSDGNVIPRGYGERYLKNKCKRGVYCDDNQQLANRRVEVVVWRFNK